MEFSREGSCPRACSGHPSGSWEAAGLQGPHYQRWPSWGPRGCPSSMWIGPAGPERGSTCDQGTALASYEDARVQGHLTSEGSGMERKGPLCLCMYGAWAGSGGAQRSELPVPRCPHWEVCRPCQGDTCSWGQGPRTAWVMPRIFHSQLGPAPEGPEPNSVAPTTTHTLSVAGDTGREAPSG